MTFVSDDKGPDGSPVMNVWLKWTRPAKAKMGGRIDLAGGQYLIIAGGKSAAKRLADILNAG
jgi:hypothetical protein